VFHGPCFAVPVLQLVVLMVQPAVQLVLLACQLRLVHLVCQLQGQAHKLLHPVLPWLPAGFQSKLFRNPLAPFSFLRPHALPRLCCDIACLVDSCRGELSSCCTCFCPGLPLPLSSSQLVPFTCP
jgi:hypothetical protein